MHGVSHIDVWKVHNTNVIDLFSVSSYRRLMDLPVMWSCRERTLNSVSCYNYYLYEMYNISTTIEHIHTFPSVEAKDLGPVHLTCIKERENEIYQNKKRVS